MTIEITQRTYRAARVLIDSTSPVLFEGAVVVEGKVIKSVGLWSEIAAQGNAGQVVDLGNVTLMPGLFDCHLHITADPTTTSTTVGDLLHSPGQMALMQRNALSMLDAGITTARDLGCAGTISCELRDSIAAGTDMGPRLLCANAPITVRGGHCWMLGGEAETIDEVRAMAGKRVAEGANVIKIMSSGGFMTAGSKPHQVTYSIAHLEAIREVAHAAGIPVTTHATSVSSIDHAVQAGLDSIEHCSWITPNGTTFNHDIARQMKAKGISVCPTMNSACRHEHYYCPWDTYEAVVANLRLLREVGVTVIAGTDNGIGLCRFERYADGLVTMNRAGYTPSEIFKAATEDAAKACGVGNITGRLVVGFEADMVALDGNPLEDIECYFRPTLVITRGRQYTPRPIEPFGDHSQEIAAMLARLQKGAAQ